MRGLNGKPTQETAALQTKQISDNSSFRSGEFAKFSFKWRFIILLFAVLSAIALMMTILILAGAVKVSERENENYMEKHKGNVSKLNANLKEIVEDMESRFMKKLGNLTKLLEDEKKEKESLKENLKAVQAKISNLSRITEKQNNDLIQLKNKQTEDIEKIQNQNTRVEDSLANLTSTTETLSNSTEVVSFKISDLSRFTEKQNNALIQLKNKQKENTEKIQNQTTRVEDSLANLTSTTETLSNSTKVVSIKISDLSRFTEKQNNDLIQLKSKIEYVDLFTLKQKEHIEKMQNQTMRVEDSLANLTSTTETLSNSTKVVSIKIGQLWNEFNTHINISDVIFQNWEQGANGSLYYFSAVASSWRDAQEYCKQSGLNLASIHSDEENTFIKENLETRGLKEAYIGLNDQANEGNFIWTDRSTFDYKKWGTGEPNNNGDEDCTCVYSTGFWYDYHCVSKVHFICQHNKAFGN